MRKTRKALHGWKQDGKFYLSLSPRETKLACNQYATSREALSEASKRHLPIIWEDPKVID
jgi:hypothetical protein